jgi:hypothetical protein
MSESNDTQKIPHAEQSNESNIKNMELSQEDIFVNLRLISKIEVGNKLIQTDKHVNIDNSYFQSITRWFKGNNRKDSMMFINVILTKSFELNDKLLHEKSEESAQILLRLNNDLKNSLNGLINLKQTYSSDKLVQSEIDVMIDNITSKLDLNSKNLNFTKSKLDPNV